MTADENLRLIREIEADRDFLLAAYRQNPTLLERAEPRIRQLFSPPPEAESRERPTDSR
jgi:hypothetical protein